MEEKLELSDYLMLCTKFEENPEDASLLEGINDFISKISVREYISLKEKEIIIMEILNTLNKDLDAPGVAAFLEIGKITNALLRYCVNLENDVPYISLGYSLVDMIYKHGLYDSILEGCEKDCKRLFKMIDDAVNASNIYRIVETASLFDQESYDEWLASMNNLKDTLDSKTLQNLLDVVGTDSEETKELIDQIKKVAVESVQNEYKSDAEKFEKASDLMSKNEEEVLEDEDEDEDDEDVESLDSTDMHIN